MPRLSTAEKILAAAGKLLARSGADAVTMRRIAQDVGITPMALYRHFADRADLLNALANAGFEQLAARVAEAAAIPGHPGEQIRKMMDVFLDFGLSKPRAFELMFLERRVGARQYPGDFRAGRSPTAGLTALAFEQGMEQGLFRRDDVWEITFTMGALLQGLVMLYVGGRVNMPEQEFRQLCHRALGRFLNGIRDDD